MSLLYIILGLFAAVVGALPPGASNVAVINTTIKEHINLALKIIIGASIAEVILSYIALYYNQMAKNFFDNNQWVQILVSVVLLAIGTFIFFNKRNEAKKKTCARKCNSKYIKGFFLGLLNPPVLIYWILVYGIVNSEVAMLSIKSELVILILFFTGVFIGKFFTLYAYGKFGIYLENKSNSSNIIINRVLGMLLVSVGVFQAVNIYLS